MALSVSERLWVWLFVAEQPYIASSSLVAVSVAHAYQYSASQYSSTYYSIVVYTIDSFPGPGQENKQYNNQQGLSRYGDTSSSGQQSPIKIGNIKNAQYLGQGAI